MGVPYGGRPFLWSQKIMPYRAKLWGKRFGRLVAKKRQTGSRWLCRCDCGNEVSVFTGKLNSGHTQSCGCLHIDRAIAANTIHGQGSSKTGRISPTYKSWQQMKRRCYNPNHDAYSYYGGRGITVCERWRNSFEAFLEDMGDRPDGMTIDRIDTDGNYEPDNCRWATHSEQMRNRRNNAIQETPH